MNPRAKELALAKMTVLFCDAHGCTACIAAITVCSWKSLKDDSGTYAHAEYVVGAICVNCLVVQDRSNMGRQMKSRAEASMRRIVERVRSTKIIILFEMDVFQSKKGNINTTTTLHLMFR